MPPDVALMAASKARRPAHIPRVWRGALLQLGLAFAALIAVFWSDWADMADQWWNSSTYNHILLVPGIVCWLVWIRVAELAKLRPAAWWPGLILIAGAMFVWLLGVLSGLNLAQHLGVVGMLQGLVLTLLGPRVFAGLIFPVGYLFLLVPFGEVFVPALQMLTAKITIFLTHLSGIPAQIDGVFIDTPAGLFEVAEACSGVKFLVAMAALSVLVAHICFRSAARRAAFLVASVVLPILANGVRAWGTIYVAQFAGLEFAESFDHIFYGWIFFALVLAVLLGLAWRYFDRAPDDPMIDGDQIAGLAWVGRIEGRQINGWACLLAIAALAALALSWSHKANALAAPVPQQIALPQVQGWDLVDYDPQVWWQPRLSGADHRLLGRYRDAQGREVDVVFGFYRNQDDGHDAGSFGEGALPMETDWRWLEHGPAIPGAKSEVLFAQGRIKRLTATFFRTGALLSGSNSMLKLANMRDRLLMRENPTLLMILSAEERDGFPASASITAFRKSSGEAGMWMDAIAQLK